LRPVVHLGLGRTELLYNCHTVRYQL